MSKRFLDHPSQLPQMAPSMKQLITRIAEKYSVDLSVTGAYLRLEQEGFMPLVIETIGRNQFSVAHYYEQNGDLIADPEVIFLTGFKDWMPFQITRLWAASKGRQHSAMTEATRSAFLRTRSPKSPRFAEYGPEIWRCRALAILGRGLSQLRFDIF